MNIWYRLSRFYDVHMYVVCFHSKYALIKVALKVSSNRIFFSTNFVIPKIHFIYNKESIADPSGLY